MFIIIVYVTDLEKSHAMAMSLEERMKRSEEERILLDQARERAENARRDAEQAASMEKEERERRVRLFTCHQWYFYTLPRRG